MIPAPVAFGLIVCEQVIVDSASGNPSPINILSRLAVQDFPSEAMRFSLFATLTDTQGTGTMEVKCLELESGEEIYSHSYSFSMPNRSIMHHVHVRVNNIWFPQPGWYEFWLFIDEDPVCQRRFRVHQPQEPGEEPTS